MNHWKHSYSDSLPLVTINSERKILGIFWKEMIANIEQVDMEEMTRIHREEEIARLIGKIVKNNEIIIKIQKQLERLLEKKKQ